MSGSSDARQATTRGQILQLLRDDGTQPRTELARRTGISATTISRLVNSLIDEGVVVEGESVTTSRPGRPAIEVSLRRDAAYVVGVQVGVGSVRLGLMDARGQTSDVSGFDFDPAADPKAVLDSIGTAVRELIDDRGDLPIIGVGVVVPGPVDPSGRTLLLPINLPWRDVPVADILERQVDHPVTVDHNVRSMALAEARFGAGRGLDSVGYVYLSTGLGAGLVVDGQPFAGGMRGAIALGHVRVIEGGRPCACGSTGCLETFVSTAALGATLDHLGIRGDGDPLSLLWRAAEHDPAAARTVDEMVDHLALALSNLVNLLNPQLILLGGRLGPIPDALFTRLESRIREAVFPLIRDAVRIERSELGMDAGVAGAGTLALERFLYA